MFYKEIVMKKVSLLIISLLVITTINAQFFRDVLSFNSGGQVSLQWNMAQPVGEMQDFISPWSYSGISIDYRHCYKNNFIIGGRTGWNGFYENKGLSDIENGVSQNYNRLEHKMNIMPVLFVVDYMVPSNIVIPYGGIGIGGYFVNSSVSSNNLGTQYTNTFHFGVSPEVGITIPFIISNFGLNISTRYNYVVKTSKTTAYSWFDFNIGLSMMY